MKKIEQCKLNLKQGMKVRIGVHTATIIDILPCSGPNGEDRITLDNNFGTRSIRSVEIL